MNTENMSNSERFINAFTLIENEMNRRIKSDRYISYSELIRRMSIMDRSYHRYARYLEEFGDLRNAIVHERIDGEVVAEPHLKEVLKIEQIASILTKPEMVMPRFERKVEYALASETMEVVLKRMLPHHYSKIPVYDDRKHFVGLLTTDAITYYMLNHIDQVKCKLPDVKVNEVMTFDPKGRTVSFLPLHATLVQVVMEFERSLTSGKRLNAILLTQDGASNQLPKGIVSISDLPIIYELLNRDLL